MSSMGDVIHTLPALTDALTAIPNIKIDWVIEPAFADIPAWHPAVKKIIPIALRKWRKNIFKKNTYSEIKTFYRALTTTKYDAIIDAQGLLKSGLVAKLARGKIHGYDKQSAREWYSSYFYHEKQAIDKMEHAVVRTRKLFSRALQYPPPNTAPDFQIDATKLPALPFNTPQKYCVFLHGTTWASKHYPENYWALLIEKADQQGIAVLLPFGNDAEKNRAARLAKNSKHAVVLPPLSIAEMATVLKNAAAVVTGDTGLGHLGAALTTPTIGLYGPTDPKRVGIVGDHQFYLQADFPCAPCYDKTCWYAKKNQTTVVPACYATIHPDSVWEIIKTILKKGD